MVNNEMPGAVTPGTSDQFHSDIKEPSTENNVIQSSSLTPEEHARREELLKDALAYAALGFEVFPLSYVLPDGTCSAAGTPHCHCNGNPKHAGKCQVLDHWDQEASSDPDVIKMWWGPAPPTFEMEGTTFSSSGKVSDDSVITLTDSWFPLGNIGLSVRNSGILPMDIDPRHGGDESLQGLEAKGLFIPATRIHRTGSEGRHLFFRAPADIEPHNYYATTDENKKQRGIADGIDLIGKGFLYAPPSIAGTGPYSVTEASDIAPLPEYIATWIRNRVAERQGRPASDAPTAVPDGRRRRYGLAALESEKKSLARCEAERNGRLNIGALALGSLSEECSISFEEAYEALYLACNANGLNAEDGDSQFNATFKSGWNKGLRSPRHPVYSTLETYAQPREWDQIGNGKRIVDAFGDVIAWNQDIKKWMILAGSVWRKSDTKTGFRFATRMIEALPEDEALSYPDDDGDTDEKGAQAGSTRERFLDQIQKWRSRGEVSAAAEFAVTHDVLCCRDEDFDKDPDLLNTPSGVVNLRTGQLFPHAEISDRFTMQTAAPYREGAQCPKFMRFLEEAQPDPEIREWIQVRTGYAAFGHSPEQIAFFDYGKGGVGKSVFTDAISGTLGSYAQGVYVETLTRARKEGTVPTDIASMAGKRYLVASETRPGQSLDEQAFKQLTGDRNVRARKMREDFSDIRRTWTIQLVANDAVHVSDDSATWRRIWVTRWEHPPTAINRNLLTEILAEEGPGILNWMIEGAVKWASEGLAVPEKVREWTAKYRADESFLTKFVEECCDITDPVASRDPSVVERLPTAIRKVYEMWRKETGAPELSRNVLASKLEELGYERASSGREYFLTLRVRWTGQMALGQWDWSSRKPSQNPHKKPHALDWLRRPSGARGFA